MKLSGCWEWTGPVDKKGYGKTYYRGKQERAHRVAYKIFIGNIPEGLCVLHKCDNPPCCNPEHLWTGTIAENNKDKMRKGRWGGGDHRGIKHGNAKLNEHQVLEIFHSKGFHTRIAEHYGVSRKTVSRIRQGKRWTHLTSVHLKEKNG